MNGASFSSPLRRADQSLIAAVVLIALVAMAGYWLHGGGHRGALVNIDDERTKPLSAKFCIDVNSASWPELAQLPGLGETLARRIVQSREHDGPFRQHHDLKRIRGLGPILLDRIQPYLLPIKASDEE